MKKALDVRPTRFCRAHAVEDPNSRRQRGPDHPREIGAEVRFRQQQHAGVEAAFADDDTEYASAISRRVAPEVCNLRCPLREQRAQGRPGARCTRGLACNCAQKTRTRAYRFSGNTPAFPAQWLYGLLRALPGERLFCHRRSREYLPRSLTPAPRRQDHTTSPYASHHPRQSWRPRPPQPVPTFVTMADAPLAGQDGDSLVLICPTG